MFVTERVILPVGELAAAIQKYTFAPARSASQTTETIVLVIVWEVSLAMCMLQS